jgi:pilus assembly protein Flp/PilA
MWGRLIKGWCKAEAGVTSIEYALIGVLVAVVIVAAVTTVGVELNATFSYVASCVANLGCP